jgi:glycosyltransferase involved in cell wall biosynthesis
MNSGPATRKQAGRIRVLFLAWGYSIHAQRRIRIFSDDPQFEVTVVSTYAYQFPDAAVILLSKAERDRQSARNGGPAAGSEKCTSIIQRILAPWILLYKFLRELYDLVKDARILRRAIRENRPDIIFLQTLLYPGYLVFFADRSIPVIITFWNGDVIWWAKWTGIERLLKKIIVIRGVARAAAITVNSKTAFNACRDYGKAAENIHLIQYPGVDRTIFFPRDKIAARNHIGQRSSRIILWPRGTGDYLNFDTLLCASENLIRKYPDLHLIVLFPNRDVDESLRDILRQKGIEMNFSLLDKVQFSDMPYYYSAADMMISLSSNDSLPNTMLEAMACGCPVIMGDIPQIREWVAEGKNGYLCPVRDAGLLVEKIQRVFEDPDRMNARFIQENLALIAKEFDSATMSRKVKSLVRELYSGHAGGDI